jgi:hypothetical protein
VEFAASSIEAALRDRGFSANVAVLAAQTAVTVFHVAFVAWVRQEIRPPSDT